MKKRKGREMINTEKKEEAREKNEKGRREGRGGR